MAEATASTSVTANATKRTMLPIGRFISIFYSLLQQIFTFSLHQSSQLVNY
jgi:hypothetical protein